MYSPNPYVLINNDLMKIKSVLEGKYVLYNEFDSRFQSEHSFITLKQEIANDYMGEVITHTPFAIVECVCDHFNPLHQISIDFKSGIQNPDYQKNIEYFLEKFGLSATNYILMEWIDRDLAKIDESHRAVLRPLFLKAYEKRTKELALFREEMTNCSVVNTGRSIRFSFNLAN